MSNGWVFVVTFGTALGCGLVAGVFFAFSTFVMKGLARITPSQGIVAMQSINITAISPLFMAALFGAAVACAVLAVFSLVNWRAPQSGYLLAGGLLYILGTVLVTMVFNVPRNNVLAVADPNGADAARLWSEYVASWTAWNHVRVIAALAAAWALMLGLIAMRDGGAA